MTLFSQIWTIAKTTFTEAIRQPVYLVLLMVGLVMLVLAPSLSAYTMEHDMDDVMMMDMGLSNLGLVSVLIAVLVAATVLAREIEVRTVLTVVSKPVPRPVFVLGKFFGVAASTSLAYLIMSLVFLLTVRHGVMWAGWKKFDQPVLIFGILGAVVPFALATGANYYGRRPFVSTFVLLLGLGQVLAFALVMCVSATWELQTPTTDLLAHEGRMMSLLVGMVLVWAAVLVMSSLATACATRLNVVPTLLICLGVAVLGITASAINQQVNGALNLPLDTGVAQSWGTLMQADETWGLKSLHLLGKTVYLVVPNLQFLWPSDAVIQAKTIPFDLMVRLLAYAGLYVVLFLGISITLFQRREVG